MKRFDQMTPDEMTCCISGFAISGFGSKLMFSFVEQTMLELINEFNAQNVKELVRAFVVTRRGSKIIF